MVLLIVVLILGVIGIAVLGVVLYVGIGSAFILGDSTKTAQKEIARYQRKAARKAARDAA